MIQDHMPDTVLNALKKVSSSSLATLPQLNHSFKTSNLNPYLNFCMHEAFVSQKTNHVDFSSLFC